MNHPDFDICLNIADTADILKVMGNHVRLRIVAFLCAGESNVKNIWEHLDIPQTTVSQHLSVLRDKGILRGVRDGVEVRYSVVNSLVRKIMAAAG
jgi:DNA-binding transcriptional ArsR family regulator